MILTVERNRVDRKSLRHKESPRRRFSIQLEPLPETSKAMSGDSVGQAGEPEKSFYEYLRDLPVSVTRADGDRDTGEFLPVTRANLLTSIREIETLSDFMKFLNALTAYSYDADHNFKYGVASDVLSAAAAFVDMMPSMYSVISDRDPGVPTWRVFAEILAYGVFEDVDHRIRYHS